MRIPSLSDLTFNMSEALPLQEALLFPERARGVAVRGPIPKTLTRFRRVMHLDLEGASTLPAWLGTLRHLRALTIHGKGFKQIPAFIFALPKLKYLFLDDTGLTTLAGIERSRTLTDVTFSRTPLAKQDNEELAASLPGAEAMNFLTGLQFERKPAKPKGKLAALLADDRIDDDADLSRADLHGAVFEDGLIAQKLVRSNLAGTVWRRCDISSDLSSANLTGARFIDCVFDNCVMENAKLAGAVFEHCAMLDLDLTGADLTNAKLTGLDHCPHIDLTRAKARGMLLAIEVLDQSEIDVLGPKADLRGATIVFDLTAEQRKAKARKTSSKLRWKTGQFKGAKLDDATQLVYQQLPAGKTSSFRIDPLGPRAEKLGRIDASNASLWVFRDRRAMEGRARERRRGRRAGDRGRRLQRDVASAPHPDRRLGVLGWRQYLPRSPSRAEGDQRPAHHLHFRVRCRVARHFPHEGEEFAAYVRSRPEQRRLARQIRRRPHHDASGLRDVRERMRQRAVMWRQCRSQRARLIHSRHATSPTSRRSVRRDSVWMLYEQRRATVALAERSQAADGGSGRGAHRRAR